MSQTEQRQLSTEYAELANNVLAASEAASRSVLLALERLDIVQTVSEHLGNQASKGVSVDEGAVALHEKRFAQAAHDDRVLAAVARPLIESTAPLSTATVETSSQKQEPNRAKPNHIRPGWMMDSTAEFWKGAARTGRLHAFCFEVGEEKYINIIADYRLQTTTPLIRLLLGVGQGSKELFKSDISSQTKLEFARTIVNAGGSIEGLLSDEEFNRLVKDACDKGLLKKKPNELSLTPEGFDKISEVNLF